MRFLTRWGGNAHSYHLFVPLAQSSLDADELAATPLALGPPALHTRLT